MKNYNLIFIFGKKDYQNDQVLLCMKPKGPASGKWNGIGGERENPLAIWAYLNELKIDSSRISIRHSAILAYPRRQVFVFGVFLEYDLIKLESQLDSLYKYWVTHPKLAVLRAFKGKVEFMEDLAYLLPLTMDPTLGVTTIQKLVE